MRCLPLLALVALIPLNAAADETTPYARWPNGPVHGPNDFPIAVWLQDPRNAAKYQQAGINLYVGLWRGPTEEQLKVLKNAGMRVICAQNAVGLAHRDDPTIAGWMHGDEPDNAQPVRDPKTGRQTYGPPIPPARIVADYEKLRAADATRPILLNLGQGVANDDWKGRGPGASLKDYETYVQGGDVVSFDVYPVAGLDRKDGADLLWYVPKGVDRLARWTENRRIVWNCVECTRVENARGQKATPHQVRAEVWMALVHGSRGIIYFVHEFKPKFNEHALLDDPEMLTAVTALNRQIRELAPVLNGPTVSDGGSVRSSAQSVPINLMVKRHAGATYAFAVGMRNAATRGSFQMRDLPGRQTVEVLGEERTLTAQDGQFEDEFAPYDVHLYRVANP